MLNFILLDEAAGNSGTGSMTQMVIMIVLLFVVFYFFMIRPQTKKQKELQQQRDAMKKGDKVVTAGGIHGIIREVQENTFLIEVSKEVCIKVDKASVYVTTDEAQQASKEADAKR